MVRYKEEAIAKTWPRLPDRGRIEADTAAFRLPRPGFSSSVELTAATDCRHARRTPRYPRCLVHRCILNFDCRMRTQQLLSMF